MLLYTMNSLISSSAALSLTSDPPEVWKTIENHSKYMVSNHGRVKSIKKNKILKVSVNRHGGYLCIAIYRDDKTLSGMLSIARLVAKHHIPNPLSKPEVNHKVSKLDNQSWNLEWVTKEENMKHAATITKVHTRPVRRIDKNDPESNGVIYESAKVAALELGYDPSGITKCCRGKTAYCGDYLWEYVDEIVDEPDRDDEKWVWLSASVYPEVSNYIQYQVSNYGRVKGKSNELLKPDSNICQNLYDKNMPRKSIAVHRLVLMAFNIPNPDSKPEIDHIDGDYTNNCLNNLRWVTKSENANNPNTKRTTPIRSTSIDTSVVKDYECVQDAVKEGFDGGAIYKCLLGKFKQHKGHKWIHKPIV